MAARSRSSRAGAAPISGSHLPPRAEAPAPVVGAARGRSPLPDLLAARRKALVVEDEPDVAETLRELIEREGYRGHGRRQRHRGLLRARPRRFRPPLLRPADAAAQRPRALTPGCARSGPSWSSAWPSSPATRWAIRWAISCKSCRPADPRKAVHQGRHPRRARRAGRAGGGGMSEARPYRRRRRRCRRPRHGRRISAPQRLCGQRGGRRRRACAR